MFGIDFNDVIVKKKNIRKKLCGQPIWNVLYFVESEILKSLPVNTLVHI